jgi:hypothetical protein
MQLRSGKQVLAAIRINNGLKTPGFIYTKQISKVNLIPFTFYVDFIRKRLAKEGTELELTESLRDYFDADVEWRDVCCYLKRGWTFEQGLKQWIKTCKLMEQS